MGRVKLQIRRIENTMNRQVTFSKRRNGLIKKAYELCILCDIDIALIMFSPSDRLSVFSGKTRIEDVILRYINLPDQERENAVIFPGQSRRSSIRSKEYLLETLQRLKTENDIDLQRTKSSSAAMNSNIEELEHEISRLQQQLQTAEEEIRKYEPDPRRFTSMEEIEACEKHLLDTLTRVLRRKESLLRNHPSSSYEPSSAAMPQDVAGSYVNDVVGWLPESGPNQAQIGMCHVSNPGDEIFQEWAQPYTSTAHFPPIQHGMVGPSMPEMMPRGQVKSTKSRPRSHG